MFQILPGLAGRAYDYFYNNQQEVPDQQHIDQKDLQDGNLLVDDTLGEESGSDAITEVRTGVDYKKVSFSELINLVKAEEMTKVSGALKTVKQKMQQSGDRLKIIDEALAQLADMGTEDVSIVVADHAALKESIEKLTSIGISSTILQKTELSKNDRASLSIFLQHKRSVEQDEIKAGRQDFQEHFERRNTLYETLMSILSTIKQSIDRIFSKG